MGSFRLRDAPLSLRIFITAGLCVVGLNYMSLLGSIWIDTEMKISGIVEGYASFEFIELIEHTFRYMTWFIVTFCIVTVIFLFTSYPERIKRIFAAAVPLLVVSDIGSMWMIRYSGFFARQLYVSGVALAVCFLVMFLMIQSDIWLNRG